jgi:hypothetical protein
MPHNCFELPYFGLIKRFHFTNFFRARNVYFGSGFGTDQKFRIRNTEPCSEKNCGTVPLSMKTYVKLANKLSESGTMLQI